jgi:predicted RND superfamily exporter protein
LVASVGFYFAEVETDFTKNFRPGTPIMDGYHFAEDQFGGAGLIEIAVRTPRALERPFLERVAEFQEQLRALPGSPADRSAVQSESPGEVPPPPALAKVISLVDVWQATGRFAALRVLPADTIVSFMRQILPQFTNYWYQWDKERRVGYIRIFARTKQQQSAQDKRLLIESIRQLADQTLVPATVATEANSLRRSTPADDSRHGGSPETAAEDRAERPYLVSGLFVLLSRIVDSLLADHVATTTVAISSIAALMYLALRDVRLVLIGLVPNLLPIFVLLGTLGWLGIPINMGVAMIAAVSIGLSVDSSIHYLWAVVRQGQEFAVDGESRAIEWAQQRIGTALTYSTVALVVGFVSLTSSQFVPTIYFGGLVSAAMVGGLLGNVVLLPAMLALRWRRTEGS